MIILSGAVIFCGAIGTLLFGGSDNKTPTAPVSTSAAAPATMTQAEAEAEVAKQDEQILAAKGLSKRWCDGVFAKYAGEPLVNAYSSKAELEANHRRMQIKASDPDWRRCFDALYGDILNKPR
jgi:hypothetical protein